MDSLDSMANVNRLLSSQSHRGHMRKHSLKTMGCFSIKTHKESLDGVLATANDLMLFSITALTTSKAQPSSQGWTTGCGGQANALRPLGRPGCRNGGWMEKSFVGALGRYSCFIPSTRALPNTLCHCLLVVF